MQKNPFTVRGRRKLWGIRRNSEPQYLLNPIPLLPCVTNIAFHFWKFSLHRRIELLSFFYKTQSMHENAIIYFWIFLVNVYFLCLLQNIHRPMTVLFNCPQKQHDFEGGKKKETPSKPEKPKPKNHQIQTKIKQPEIWKSNINAGSLFHSISRPDLHYKKPQLTKVLKTLNLWIRTTYNWTLFKIYSFSKSKTTPEPFFSVNPENIPNRGRKRNTLTGGNALLNIKWISFKASDVFP